MKKNTLKKSLTFFIMLFCAVNFGFGQILTFDFAGLAGNEFSANSNSNNIYLEPSSITRGAGLNRVAKMDRFNATGWASTSIANAVTGNDYMEFTISPISGYQFGITTMIFNIQRSASGLSAIALRSSIDGYAANIDGVKAIIDNERVTEVITFTVNQAISATAVTYRVYGYAEAGTGTGGFEGTGNDIIVNGSVSALPPCGVTATTWDGTSWNNGLPNISTPAIISGDYYTSSGGNQISFSACTLTVTNNASLNIDNNDYIEVANELTVDAGSSIYVEPYGAFVQNNDASINSISGNISVSKETAPMNTWYEYTYWSSPVAGAEFQVALDRSPVDRRFKFNGQNFLDHCAETGNNNILICDDGFGNGIQDNIDDDNNDWVWLPGNTIMQPGIGYATTLTEFAYNIAPGTSNKKFRFTFVGPFNNGEYTVPIYRNDSEPNDYNWNFIGNPYPSAIDADLFLAANSNIATDISTPKSLNGAIFLWSQSTPPSNTTNGNQGLNFSSDDYAIINAVGESAGGDGVTPNRLIPSGQGFLVSMSNAAPASVFSGDVYKATNDVVFNNSMRVKGATDNSQFFKNTKTKGRLNTAVTNKLWINLTSDNGVFNQILVGYVNGATNGDDGVSYDTHKYSAKGTILYSIIEGSTKKFAIQGKDANSINENEVIKLGFKSSIKVATLFKLSIAQLEGNFLNSNNIYLKDNLLNKVHNLSASDYTFTSAVGEFNNRFEMAFSNQALSLEEVLLSKHSLKIVELENDNVQFNTSNNLSIKSVHILDLLGRPLYHFTGNSASETYKLSNLKSSVFIAKVELSNGGVITKKAFKK
ncbi:hypothetical protein QLS71_005990 [Mariniflexile litorale]|uniref:Secreted protein (Por secretion system target) n=1 Tax=Mariniflexile litorale TaxID=3045158 RepID=A0AAU7EJD0_9FLAO|nr:hypothetical protein [Mariniflexile sp. KMM 9835]MDQ8211128.1 hypothetical protein [Mariniflexile sp. KMM 9835]